MSSPSDKPGVPPYAIVFGPQANCTIHICDVGQSVYGYRPSLGANATFIALFAIAGLIHTYLGIRWRSWFFMWCMILGCTSAIIGYIGRVMMYYNPFTFAAFMIQIVCVSTTPIYFCAAIYVTLAATIQYYSPSLSRFSPKFLYWVFIPCDVVSLAIQAAGGGMSTTSSGSSQVGVDLALVGLSFQVFTLTVFCGLFGDYMWRLFSSGQMKTRGFSGRIKIFFGFLTLAILLILIRCAYRLAELHAGYTAGSLVREQGLFIGFEGVMIITSVFCLMLGHPGLVFRPSDTAQFLPENDSEKEASRV